MANPIKLLRNSLVFTAMTLSSLASATKLQIQVGGDISSAVNQRIIKVRIPKLSVITNGELKLELVSGGSIVPHRETLDAIDRGLLGGDFVLSSYFAGKDFSFAIMGDLVAGYDTPLQTMQFCYLGGGRDMLQKIVDSYSENVKVIGCGSFERESLVSSKLISSVKDLKGLKVRAPEGLAAEVFSRAGAVTIPLPFSEVYTSLEKGVIDAADASNYTTNKEVGFNEIAKYPLYPGIHSMPGSHFTVNGKLYEKLSESNKVALDLWFQAMSLDLMMWVDIRDKVSVAKDIEEAGETGLVVTDWPLEERNKLREIAKDVWADSAKQSPLAKEAYELNVDFMNKLGLLEK